jgi:competence protein ComEC
MLGYITGVILLYFSGDLINSSKDSLNYYTNLQLIVPAFSLSLLFYSFISKEIRFQGLALYLLGLCLGYSYASFSAEKLYSAQISSFYDHKIIQVNAFLCGLPREGKYFFSADFCLLEIKTLKGKTLPGKGFKARLRWPLDVDMSEGISTFHVKSRQPRSTVNFIGSSFENSLNYKKIILMGEIKERTAAHTIATVTMQDRLQYEYHQLRKKISHYTDKNLEGTLHKGVIKALLLGDRSQLSKQDYSVLANTGTQHLIAISGLHVGLVMLGLYYLLPRSMFSIISISIIGIAYVLLVGFTPSAQRAWVMCTFALIYLSGYFKQSKWKSYVLALFAILSLDPLATLNLGFWYSFLCVAIIFIVLQFTSLDLKRWQSLLALQFILIIAMVPLNSVLGVRHGLENILANIFAIPWVSLFVLPLALFSFITSFLSEEFAACLLTLLDGAIELLSSYLASLKIFLVPMVIDIHPLTVASFVLVFVAMLVFNKIRRIYFMCLLSLLLVIVFPSRLFQDNTELIVFDVGQGLALAIMSKQEIWLYDTGPAFDKGSSTRHIILPYLRQHQKSSKLTGLIVSHGDADHAGDLWSLYDEFKPSLAWSGQPERLEVSGFELCQAGMHWKQSGLSIEILYPFPNIDLLPISSNNHSCVVRLKLFNKVFLLMGDLESEAELSLVKHYRDKLKADVLIAGHHGASKGSSFALLKHVKPDYIVFSAGYLNKFGHPSEAVLERVARFKMTILNTSETGALRFNKASLESSFYIESAR